MDEVQHVSCLCNGCSGNFVLKFKGETTVNILPTATPAELETAFEVRDNHKVDGSSHVYH